MQSFCVGIALLVLLVQPSGATARQPLDEDAAAEADRIANEVTADADNAREAAATAKQAAVVANNVAEHSVKVTTHAKSALKHALGALHDARVDSKGLDASQKDSLKKAEGKLREATKSAEFGKLKKAEYRDASDIKKEKMQIDLDKRSKKTTELEQMKQDVRELRAKLKARGGDDESIRELKEMEDELDRQEREKKDSKSSSSGTAMVNDKADEATKDEMKAEIERLRDQIEKLEEQEAGAVDYSVPEAKRGRSHVLPSKGGEDKELMRDVKMKPLGAGGEEADIRIADRSEVKYEATPVEEKGIDIDTQMPYGDLEPFGREDTAQELTESSVRESDEMVDQLERAEVAEEKRAVFRALTRLRGAAITSFDGVARSQTGNIDEYNKIHKWRKTHPLHHLADEESDITKWAFPDNADLLQVAHPKK